MTHRKIKWPGVIKSLMVLAILFATGCATSVGRDTEGIGRFNSHAAMDWNFSSVQTAADMMLVVGDLGRTGDELRIYIEGDGAAWKAPNRPPANPTPRRALALELALADDQAFHHGATAYIARPCQFLSHPKAHPSTCDAALWTHARFSDAVVQATNQVIDTLKARADATRLVLIGYSGGGVLAALVAARRDDVGLLISIAAPLDHATWTAEHGVSPLTDSLDPGAYWSSLQHIPQIHYVGERDRVVSEQTVSAYALRFPPNKQPDIRVIPDFDHRCCWVESWPELLRPATNESGMIRTEEPQHR